MQLCAPHLSTAFGVGLSVQRLTPAGDALDALLDLYGIGELSLIYVTVEGAEATAVRSSASASYLTETQGSRRSLEDWLQHPR